VKLRLECRHEGIPLASFLELPVDVQENLGMGDRVFVVHDGSPCASALCQTVPGGDEVEVSRYVLLCNSPRLHAAAASGNAIDVVCLKLNAEGQPFMDGPRLATEIARATVFIGRT